jgi:glutamate synthase domain-containing protein 2
MNYKKASDTGLLKILSRMGISLLTSYLGGQIFEIIGLSQEVTDKCFCGSNSPVGGLTFRDIEKETSIFLKNAYDERAKMEAAGFDFSEDKQEYCFNPNKLVELLAKSIKDENKVLEAEL